VRGLGKKPKKEKRKVRHEVLCNEVVVGGKVLYVETITDEGFGSSHHEVI